MSDRILKALAASREPIPRERVVDLTGDDSIPKGPFTVEGIDEPHDADEVIERVLADRRIVADNMVLRHILLVSTPVGLTFPNTLSTHHAAIENRRCRLKMLGVDDAGMERVEAAAARNSRLGGLHEDTFVEVERRILRGEMPSTVVDDVAHGDDSKEGGER